jgi:hypothetical protein
MDLDPAYKPNNKRYGKHSPIGIQTHDGEITLTDCHKMVTMDDIAMLDEFFSTFVIVDIERLSYLDQYLDLPTVGAVLAMDVGAYNALHRCIEADCIVPSRYTFGYLEMIEARHKAARCGHLEVLKWLNSEGIIMDSIVAEKAAKYGHLEVLKWLKSESVKMNTDVAKSAASGGQLEVLKWLKSEGVVMNTRVAHWAAQRGHLEVLKWLKEQDVEMNNKVACWAASGGQLEVLKWIIKSEGVEMNINVAYCAAENGHIEILNWLKSEGVEF